MHKICFDLAQTLRYLIFVFIFNFKSQSDMQLYA